MSTAIAEDGIKACSGNGRTLSSSHNPKIVAERVLSPTLAYRTLRQELILSEGIYSLRLCA